MREVTTHIIHCSDSPEDTTVSEIKKWHLARGFNDIGYHFVITQDGRIHRGRDINVTGAHAKGYNTGSVGTCLVGKEEFTAHQIVSLQSLHDALCAMYNKDLEVKGHNEVNAGKTCPNFNVHQFIKGLE